MIIVISNFLKILVFFPDIGNQNEAYTYIKWQ